MGRDTEAERLCRETWPHSLNGVLWSRQPALSYIIIFWVPDLIHSKEKEEKWLWICWTNTTAHLHVWIKHFILLLPEYLKKKTHKNTKLFFLALYISSLHKEQISHTAGTKSLRLPMTFFVCHFYKWHFIAKYTYNNILFPLLNEILYSRFLLRLLHPYA